LKYEFLKESFSKKPTFKRNPLMNKDKKYVAYFRVSTKKQGESGLGLEAQRTYINHFYKDIEFISEFTENVSGKDIANRPELKKALELCKKEKAVLVVAKIDRLSRKTEHALAIYSELEGRLESCDIPNLDKFTLTLIMSLSDREGELISLRTKAALDEKKKKGVKLGNAGKYLNDEARAKSITARTKKASESPLNMQVSMIIKSKKAEGETLAEIAANLNSVGFKTSRGKEFGTHTVNMYLQRIKKAETLSTTTANHN
jgi:DNA invertase Pin-like site-specific DNA recombinase